MNKFLLTLRARKLSWRDIYWKVWGIIATLRCTVCGQVPFSLLFFFFIATLRCTVCGQVLFSLLFFFCLMEGLTRGDVQPALYGIGPRALRLLPKAGRIESNLFLCESKLI